MLNEKQLREIEIATAQQAARNMKKLSEERRRRNKRDGTMGRYGEEAKFTSDEIIRALVPESSYLFPKRKKNSTESEGQTVSNRKRDSLVCDQSLGLPDDQPSFAREAALDEEIRQRQFDSLVRIVPRRAA